MVELRGFRTERREGLRFEVAQVLTFDFSLPVAGVAETVTVRLETPLVETSKTTVDASQCREQIDESAAEWPDAANLAWLALGVVQRGDTDEPVTGGGQPRGSGEILVDGVSTEMMATNRSGRAPRPTRSRSSRS